MTTPTPESLGAAMATYLHGIESRVAALETPNPPSTPAPSATLWPSGVARPGNDTQYTQASLDAWKAWRGPRDGADFTLTYPWRGGDWPDLINPGYALGTWTRPGTTIVVAQPFTPDRYAQAATVNAGATDTQWQTWGRSVAAKKAAGFRVITSLAWEPNGNWFPWSAKDAKAHVAAFRRVVDNIRATCSDAEISFTVNAGGSQNPPSKDPRDLWPGKEYVDHVGIDLYDHWPRAVGDDAVAAREATPYRAQFWASWATGQGLPTLWPEWGLNTVSPQGGGDNPAFIRWMHAFFARLWAQRLPDGRPALTGESYFDDYTTTNVGSGLREWNRNPNSAAEYRRLFVA